ncbi:hypothetical protein [Paenibacillus tepidiphilus]|uniref:hypothetical protein n=1 Tax=Paenibacillus tepidiphilus TaxID=2608683 RepID=UPI00123C6F14|nr:hypothetical protein [Paenibacillus tepidiphilus]
MTFYTFEVTFVNGNKQIIKDINNFDDTQIKQIQGVAAEWEQPILKAQKYGINLNTIRSEHKSKVVNFKNRMVSGVSSLDLLKRGIILIAFHSVERTLKRMGSKDESMYITLIDRIVKANEISKVQWKGHAQLSYTFINNSDPEEYILPLSFLLKRGGSHQIKLLTVVYDDEDKEFEAMENRLIENPLLAESFKKMEKLFKKT